jgi:EAL domain-containing protein (putative c-di-GMP-specific phosphodiesterase class I)/CheY-like chemotaxis protein
MRQAPDQGVKSVLYLGTDPALWDLLRASIAGSGVSLRGCRTLAGLALAASLEPVEVLILEATALAPGRTPGHVLDRVQAASGVRPLLLCLGDAGEGPLEGGRFVLHPPFDQRRLAQALEGLLHRPRPEGSRLLLLGDSPIQDDYYARLLRGAGMRVERVSDPGQIESTVERLRPHLAILDLDMEAGEGDLGGRLRDCPACQDLPIVFLSGDLSDGEGVSGRRIGGDDYLVKPVEPHQLIATVRARVGGGEGPEAGPSVPEGPGAGLVQTAVHFLQRLDKEVVDRRGPAPGEAILYLEPDEGLDALAGAELGDVAVYQRVLVDRLVTLVEPRDRGAWLSDLGLALWVTRRDAAEVAAFAERVLRALESAQAAGQRPLPGLSLGIGAFLPPADDAHTLISRAQSACAQARAAGGARVVVHHCPGDLAPAGDIADGAVNWADEAIAPLLRRALEGEGFRLLYQPILPLRKVADRRYEVLLRLRTPEGVIIPPLTFLPVARRLGLLPALDRWVLSGALRVLRQERDAGRPTRFLIHQTPESLASPSWLDWVREEILRLDLIRQRPLLVFSAQGILANEVQARHLFPDLARLGIEVCLTGITDSKGLLRLIRRRGITCVKLARELASQGTPRVLKAVVEALHGLGVCVIASGIEDPETIGRVWSSGVDYIQGNLIQFPEETLDFNFGETALQ